MKRSTLAWAIVLAMLVAGCRHTSRPGSACLSAPFTGITPTDETGQVVGPADPKDWGCMGSDESICLPPASPNPARFAVRIGLQVSFTTTLDLTLYRSVGLAGAPIRKLASRSFVAGRHEITWDLTDDRGRPVPSGTYRLVCASDGGMVCGDIQVVR